MPEPDERRHSPQGRSMKSDALWPKRVPFGRAVSALSRRDSPCDTGRYSLGYGPNLTFCLLSCQFQTLKWTPSVVQWVQNTVDLPQRTTLVDTGRLLSPHSGKAGPVPNPSSFMNSNIDTSLARHAWLHY